MGKAKRGRVYRCKKCKWQNEKAYALKHVAKKHVEVPPVRCNPCNFNGVTMACIMEHTKTSTHKKKAATYDGQIIQCAEVDLESYLEKIPKDESDRFWEKKSQKVGSSETDEMETTGPDSRTASPKPGRQKPVPVVDLVGTRPEAAANPEHEATSKQAVKAGTQVTVTAQVHREDTPDESPVTAEVVPESKAKDNSSTPSNKQKEAVKAKEDKGEERPPKVTQ